MTELDTQTTDKEKSNMKSYEKLQVFVQNA